MDKKEDEDITIDFSKFRNLFKAKKHDAPENISQHKQEVKPEEKNDDEISIDFKKVRNIFAFDSFWVL